VFTQHQLSSSLRPTNLAPTVLRVASLLDTEQIRSDILANLADDPVAKLHLGSTSDPRWVTDQDGFLQLDNRTYVPEAQDLRLCILQYKHDHILSGHFGVTKTLELIRRDYVSPGMQSFVKGYCRSCTPCMRNKPQRHKPYGLLKQLPVPEKPWN
jgi:Integrase zinc binding domain